MKQTSLVLESDGNELNLNCKNKVPWYVLVKHLVKELVCNNGENKRENVPNELAALARKFWGRNVDSMNWLLLIAIGKVLQKKGVLREWVVCKQNWKRLWRAPGGSDGKDSTYIAGDLGLIPGSGRSPGEGNGNPLQYSYLENSMDRGDWWAIVLGVA